MFLLLALYCPDGWEEFANSCYKVMKKFRHPKKLKWEGARAVCLGFEGDLVSITNKMEMEFVNNLSSELKNDHIWIGLNNRSQEGKFVWSDGSIYNSSVYVNWLDVKPSNRGKIRCVELWRNGWNPEDCSKENQYYICERPKGNKKN